MTKEIFFQDMINKGVDLSFLTLNAALAVAEGPNININTISAAGGLLWLIIARLPKAIFYLNKAIQAMKTTVKGKPLDDNFINDTYKNQDHEEK